MSEADKLAGQIQDASKACEVLGLPPVKDWCSTGCTVLDLAISNNHPGGMPIGRVVQVFGGASTAKSVLATTILGSALRAGKHAFYADVERTLDPAFAGYYGLDCTHENFNYGFSWDKDRGPTSQPTTLEEFFDDYLGGILNLRTRKPKVIVVDSITALPAAFEVESEMTKKGFGAYRAKQISLGMRKYISLLAKKNVTLFVVDQTRDNVGGDKFGPQEVTTGGRGMEFYSSCRLYLKHSKAVINSKEKAIGVWVRFSMIKNKVAPPFRKGKFKIIFDYGLDDITSNLAYLASVQKNETDSFLLTTQVVILQCAQCGKLLLDGSDACSCGGSIHRVCDKCGKGLPEGEICPCDKKSKSVIPTRQIQHWLSLIEKENREKELADIVAAVWADEYSTAERKPRTW